MKLCLFLITGFFLLGFGAAYAQSPAANFFGQKKKLPPTPEQIDESFAVYDECKASDMVRKYYDCECVSASYLQLRTQHPNEKIDTLATTARQACGNVVSVAGIAYERCLGWATKMRTDYERYCTCYANSYAKTFTKSPTDSIRGREIMMTNALNGCNDGSQITENKARKSLIDQLKKEGIYDTLFPNAKTDPSLKPEQSPQ